MESVKNFLVVTDLLRQNSISFICLKGPLLSYRIYKDPSVRYFHDIDLLIDKKDIEPVIKILLENKYQMPEGIFWPSKKIQQELFTNAIHHLSFQNKESHSIIEIHWVLMHDIPLSVKKQMHIINANTTETEFVKQRFTVLTKEFELLYLLIHGSRHRWNRLKWLIDIKEYPIKDIDTQKFIVLIKQFKAWRVVNQTNYLLKKFLNTHLPFENNCHIPKYLIQYSLQSINDKIAVENSTQDLIHNYRYQFLLFPGLYYKSKVILASLFRPGDIMKIDSSFKIVYYLYRPYSFIKRRILYV